MNLQSPLIHLRPQWLAVFAWALALADSSPAAVVGLWRFGENAGTTASDGSGFGNHGTLESVSGSPLPEWVSSAPGFGSAVRFKIDEQGFGSHWIHVLHDASLNLTNQFTLAAWVYDEGSIYGRILEKGIDPSNGLRTPDSYNWETDNRETDQVYFWEGIGASAFRQGGGFTLPKNVWHHYAVTYDGVELVFYLDGAAQTTVAVTGSLRPNEADLIIGNRLQRAGLFGPDDRGWNGMLDDIAIFDTGLNVDQIATVMKGDFASFIVSVPPTLIASPAGITVTAGVDLTLTVKASGTKPFSYQWRRDGQDIPGAIQSTYLLSHIQPSLAGFYTVVVKNSKGEVESEAAEVVVTGSSGPELVGLWRFDEGNDTFIGDASIYQNHGMLSGAVLPTWDSGQPGFGSALHFANDGANRSYVDIPGSDSLRVGLTPADTWTFAIWAFEESDGAGNYLATYGRFFAQDDGRGLYLDSGANGDSQLYVWHEMLPIWRQGLGVDSAVRPLLDQWIHWALVYDGASLTVYRNGNEGPQGGKVTKTITSALLFNGYTGGLKIGGELRNPPSRGWQGLLDDFAVFRGALSETQIRNLVRGDYAEFLGEGAPRLSIAPVAGKLVVSWPADADGFAPEATDALLQGIWIPVTTVPQTDGDMKSITIEPTGAAQYFRLRKTP